MSAGLTIRNLDGTIMVDMTRSYSQVVGKVTTNRVAGSLPVSIPEGLLLWYTVTSREDAQGSRGKAPGVTLTHSLLTWSYLFNTGFAMDCDIIYGYLT